MSDQPQRPVVAAVPPAPVDEVDDAEVERGHRVLTEGVGVLDRSAAGKLSLTGTEAAGFLTGQVTADIEAIAPGHGSYAALLTPKGKIVCDLRVLNLDGELFLLCERVGLQSLFDQLRRHLIGFDAELHKQTLQRSLLSLIGPGAGALLGDAAAGLGPAEHDHVAAEIGGRPVRLVRTAEGVDLLAAAEDGAAVLSALREAGAVPVPEAAAEIVRVRAGRPRLGQEMDDGVMPAEVGIVDRAVSFTKGCYVGQETVARLHWRGRPNRHLRGLRLERSVPPGTVLVADGREIGRVTTSVRSPVDGPIALALVRREIEPGDRVTLRPADGSPTSARVVALPFDAPRAAPSHPVPPVG
ncbi:CAF17-like 4Fe-4S cluster assembly/insertion protein YgfZ [Patulibacter defluvii]|uniref:CAF17-like 4Fe-4S cluster assembly/insertion protein YgfZ n=1 Tax=Patulibacter defluvii TaxID=3095358 RepID=UPI002A765674|nr:glycine cleavage T C-terminal barrel domain-containing protein [Patulibacter sp. DM4]